MHDVITLTWQDVITEKGERTSELYRRVDLAGGNSPQDGLVFKIRTERLLLLSGTKETEENEITLSYYEAIRLAREILFPLDTDIKTDIKADDRQLEFPFYYKTRMK